MTGDDSRLSSLQQWKCKRFYTINHNILQDSLPSSQQWYFHAMAIFQTQHLKFWFLQTEIGITPSKHLTSNSSVSFIWTGKTPPARPAAICLWLQFGNNTETMATWAWQKAGRAQEWSHITITGEQIPPSLLFVELNPRNLARPRMWGIQCAY